MRPSAWHDGAPDIATELRYLAATVAELEHVQSQQELTVQLLRVAGVSWTVIGTQLGVSRQAARQRFGSLTLLG